ncbi:tyrosine-type recombinase/integrase [Nonomuraea sp. NPDC050556]|uniref:tyrosine-type recombinase/integrase n=1 Tax=Nonomuraea sp. NPDC050556 TaxID=3364369 RepID=UPI0037950C52
MPSQTPSSAVSADGQDRRKFTSGKVVGLSGELDPTDDDLGVWVERYLDLAVRGVRSAEVTAKISRHLQRLRAWIGSGLGHERVSAITARELAAWRDHLAAAGWQRKDGSAAAMAPATVNNHLAHASALFSWISAHAPAALLPGGDPSKRVEPLRLPAPEVRALNAAQVRTVKNVLDRLESFHQLNGRRHRGGASRGAAAATHRHARPLRDRAIVHTMLGTGLRRAEIAGLDLTQLQPREPEQLRRAKKAKLTGVRGKGRTTRSVFLGRDARTALADYLQHERGGDLAPDSTALFLAASSIAARQPDGRLSPRSINTIVGEIGAIHDLQVVGGDRQLGVLRPHDLRHTFAYLLSQASGHNRAELERRLGHANERYLKLYTNPPEEIAASYVEDL